MKRLTSFAAFLIFAAMGSFFCGCQYIPMMNYTVTYNDGVDDADISVPSENTYTVGVTVSINFEEIGERPGYTFKCWSDGSETYAKGTKEDFVMGMDNITLTAIWELIPAPQPQPEPAPEPEQEQAPEPEPEAQPDPESEQTPQTEPEAQPEQPPAPVYASYTVKHYKQNANDDNYTLDYTSSLRGIVGSQTQASSRHYEHYTADPITQATIAEDGSTEIRINYSLETITLTLNLAGGTLNSESGTITRSGKYGQTVNIYDPIWEGHSFTGWNVLLPGTFTENRTYTATWSNTVISVIFSSVSDLTVTKNVTGSTITLIPLSGFSNYSWKIDGVNATSMSGVSTNNRNLIIPITSLTPNAVYQVALTATRNGILYSTQLSIRNGTN